VVGLAGSLGLQAVDGVSRAASAGVAATSRVALQHGGSRAEIVFQALKSIEPDVRAALAKKKRVIIKPNMVVTDRQLAATHADCLEGILEFLGPLVKEPVLIAESPANGPAAEGYANYGYSRLEKAYPIKLVDLDVQSSSVAHMVDERHCPRAVRYSTFLLDPEAFVVSTANLKAHDRAVVTLSLKNLAVGALLKDTGYRWGPGSEGISDKAIVHGGRENQGIHFNLFHLAKKRAPDLTVLDGFEGMEHNGPVNGTPVDHRVAVASADWLAAERVGVELMGFDFAKVGYLTFCAKAGMGQANWDAIEIVGERMTDHIRSYQPHDNIERQYRWLQEA
ncbi:MAG TPA: DUF362 domain-containing protein, partial [Candidatus Hydrogenedentes bacterium]|nr:DUF362 domain-containing protein [Candidatus Hydrogenedentota bacterium]